MMRSILLFVFTICLQVSTLSQEIKLPWYSTIDPDNVRVGIETVSTSARVEVSDGLKYNTESFYWGNQRSVMKFDYPDKLNVFGIDGMYLWTHDGKEEKEAPPFVRDFVLGHQFHSKLLFFDKGQDSLTEVQSGQFRERDCYFVEQHSSGSVWKAFYNNENKLLGFELTPPEYRTMPIYLDDWRNVEGISLPFHIQIVDGERIFDYHYNEVVFNKAKMDDFRLEVSKLSDEQILLRMHRKMMDDHLKESANDIVGVSGDTLVIVNRGEVERMGLESFKQVMEYIMSSRDYKRYDDLIRPVVKVSEDGTLGWVIVKIIAEGIIPETENQQTNDFQFISAWIELYEKQDGEWKMIGNVSNFKNGN